MQIASVFWFVSSKMCPPLTRGYAGILALSNPSYIRIKGFVDLFHVYLLSHVDIIIRYIKVDFTFGLPDYVRYIEEFVISRFVILYLLL